MGELKIQYSDKKVTPFGGMKLLKDFIDKTDIIKNLESVNIPQPQSNAGINPIDIIQGFWLSIFTGASRYIHADWLRYDTVLQEIFNIFETNECLNILLQIFPLKLLFPCVLCIRLLYFLSCMLLHQEYSSRILSLLLLLLVLL